MRNFFADFRRVIGFFIVTAAFALPALAQDFTDTTNNATISAEVANAQLTDEALNAKNEFSVLGGFAPDIPRLFSGSRRSSYGEIDLRYSRRLATSKNLAIKYQFDFVPLAVISYRADRLFRTSPTTLGTDRERQTAYAIGITPASFQLNFRRREKIQPFITAGAGLLIFGRKIPDDRSPVRPDQVGRRLNFTPFFGGGAEFLTDDGRAYTVGFKFHHISNNSTATINPGFDQNYFYFGYTFKKW